MGAPLPQNGCQPSSCYPLDGLESWLVCPLKAKRDSKGQPASNFVEGMAVGQRVAVGDIERELVVDLPNQPYKPRNSLLETKLLLVENFCDRPHFPARRSLQ